MTDSSVPDTDRIHDVVQIGYGPVGQAHAALLGRRGHDIAVFERHPTMFNLSRAGHMDHEIMRILQSIDCAAEIEREAVSPDSYDWLTADLQPMMRFPWKQDVSGWRTGYLFYQPVLETALDREVRRLPTVRVHQGWEVTAVAQYSDHVEVTVSPKGSDGVKSYVVRGRYLVAADGGNSFVRRALGIEMRDLGYRNGWLVIDFRLKRHLEFDFDNGQICNPHRPTSLFHMGYQNGAEYRRFSFAAKPGETDSELLADETVWALVEPWVRPDDAELIRKAYYMLEAKVVDDLRRERVLLVGDAGHVMPPFLGQGMCSGIRDVCNLSWKLDLVLRDKADSILLDSYSVERQPHSERYADISAELARILCMTDVGQAEKRDQEFLDGTAPALKPLPWVEKGILQAVPPGGAAAVVGRLGPQAVVQVGERRARADDILGAGWCLISRGEPGDHLDAASRGILEILDCGILHFGSEGALDISGAYTTYLDEAGLDAVLVRPDHYVFGGVTSLGDLNELLSDLHAQLHLTSQGSAR